MKTYHLLVCHESQEVFIMEVSVYETDTLRELFIIKDTSTSIHDLNIAGIGMAMKLGYTFNK